MKFACEVLDLKDMRNNYYSEVFDVSKEEVYEYVFENGIPQKYCMLKRFLNPEEIFKACWIGIEDLCLYSTRN